MKTSQYMQPQRLKDESFHAYKARRCSANNFRHEQRQVWDSSNKNTYQKSDENSK